MTKRYFYIPFLTIVLSSCNIFQTRTPQPPQEGQSNFAPPQLPSIVIENLKNSIVEKNPEDYLFCLSDTAVGSYGGRRFSFQPPSDVFLSYQSIFQNWNRNSENLYFNNFRNSSSPNSTPALNTTGDIYTNFSSDSVEYAADYDLEWPNTVQGFDQSFHGFMQLYIVQDEHGNWAICKWVDFRTSDSLKTWSELKAKLINQ